MRSDRAEDAAAGDRHRAPGDPAGAGHAVVIGAGMAGLAVAKALTAGFDRVTVVERDRLSSDPGHRPGVPQDRHLHLLLPAGMCALEALFPALGEQLAAGGATSGDTDRIRVCLNGHRLARARTGHRAVFASRPFLEAHVRRRVCEDGRITVRDGVGVAGLAVDGHHDRVTGVELGPRGGTAPASGAAGQELPAELVVDCSGRRSPVPRWLAALGHDPPEVDDLDVEVRYSTRRYELPRGVLDGDRHVLVGPTPDGPCGGAMTRVEDGTWIVTLFAMAGQPAPTDGDAFEGFAAGLPIDDIHRAIRSGRAVTDPQRYRFPANRRHRYDRLDRLPEGLLIAGDALCSFNPIYGQGMSVAAIEARMLEMQLRAAGRPSARSWFAAVTGIVDTAWKLAVGSDLAVRAVRGPRPASVRALNRYVARLEAAARSDPDLAARLVRVLGLVDPPTRLLRPRTAAAVLRSALRVT